MIDEQPVKVLRAAGEIGEDFAGWRKILGLTTQQVAERAGVTRDTLRKLEHGHPTVGFHVVLKVARLKRIRPSGKRCLFAPRPADAIA